MAPSSPDSVTFIDVRDKFHLLDDSTLTISDRPGNVIQVMWWLASSDGNVINSPQRVVHQAFRYIFQQGVAFLNGIGFA